MFTILEAQQQVTANLANFAYDPINYEFLKKAKAHDLFLEVLPHSDEKLVLHGIAGLCNFVTDKLIRDYVIRSGGIRPILKLLRHSNKDIVINALTTLIFLNTEESKSDIFAKENINRVKDLVKTDNKRVQNVANLFLENANTPLFNTR